MRTIILIKVKGNKVMSPFPEGRARHKASSRFRRGKRVSFSKRRAITFSNKTITLKPFGATLKPFIFIIYGKNLYKDSVYYSNRAQSYRQLSNWTEVLKDACEAIRLDQDNYKAFNLKGMAQIMQSRELSISQDEWEKLSMQGIKSMQKALDMINESTKKQDFQLISSIQTNISKANQIFNLKRAEKLQYKKKQINQLVKKLLNKDNSSAQSQQEILDLIERKTNPNQMKLPDAFMCIFTLDPMVNPVITSSGLSYEKSLLDDHVKANGEVDPTTRVKIDPKKYIENVNLKQAIQDYKSKTIDSEYSNNYNQIVF